MAHKSDLTRRLVALRKAKGLTQQQLADAVGSHWITISKLERGVIRLTEDWLDRLAQALGVELTDFFPEPRRLFTVEIDGEILPDGSIGRYDDDIPHILTVDSSWLYPDASRWYYVNTTALLPWFRDGDAICVVGTELPPERYVGRLCFVRAKDDSTRVGILVRGSRPGYYQVHSPAGAAGQDIEIEFLAPVVMSVYDVPLD